ncbi:hypothetical protein [Polymorphobacter megasporae]|nr:hypothetical protein [Polymorphobacter megasporae]UAJ12367.1 hypothetical protein KTC28_21365 [Polymorphobacter megasporae]
MIEALRRRHGGRRKDYAVTADDAVQGNPVAQLQARLIEAERGASPRLSR